MFFVAGAPLVNGAADFLVSSHPGLHSAVTVEQKARSFSMNVTSAALLLEIIFES